MYFTIGFFLAFLLKYKLNMLKEKFRSLTLAIAVGLSPVQNCADLTPLTRSFTRNQTRSAGFTNFQMLLEFDGLSTFTSDTNQPELDVLEEIKYTDHIVALEPSKLPNNNLWFGNLKPKLIKYFWQSTQPINWVIPQKFEQVSFNQGSINIFTRLSEQIDPYVLRKRKNPFGLYYPRSVIYEIVFFDHLGRQLTYLYLDQNGDGPFFLRKKQLLIRKGINPDGDPFLRILNEQKDDMLIQMRNAYGLIKPRKFSEM